MHQWVADNWARVNETQFLCAFGFAVMCLFRSDIQHDAGEASFPCAWWYSLQGNTGKSTTGDCILSLFGLHGTGRNVLHGHVKLVSDASLYVLLDSLVDCVVIIDDKDVDPSDDKRKKDPKKLYALMHNLADGDGRRTRRGEDGVKSGVAFCSNGDPPKGSAQNRRVLKSSFVRAAELNVASSAAKMQLNGLRNKAYYALPVLFSQIKYDALEVDQVRIEFTNTVKEIEADQKLMYAHWLYFTFEYARVVLNKSRDEVWRGFCTDILGRVHDVGVIAPSPPLPAGIEEFDSYPAEPVDTEYYTDGTWKVGEKHWIVSVNGEDYWVRSDLERRGISESRYKWLADSHRQIWEVLQLPGKGQDGKVTPARQYLRDKGIFLAYGAAMLVAVAQTAGFVRPRQQ